MGVFAKCILRFASRLPFVRSSGVYEAEGAMSSIPLPWSYDQEPLIPLLLLVVSVDTLLINGSWRV